jgi:hypothetical protein
VVYDRSDRNSVFDLVGGLGNLPACPLPPDPVPPRPPVPASFVDQLQARVDGSNELSRSEQTLLLADIKDQLGAMSKDSAMLLLFRLRTRADVYQPVAREVEELLLQLGA